MRVLIIEDDKAVSGFISKGLREAGHQSQVAGDGKEGLLLASAGGFDVIVVDRMLPGLDGLSILQTLRASENGTPALVLSALGRVDDRVKGLRSGGDDYLVKPFAFSELLARLEVLAARGLRVETTTTRIEAFDLTMDLLSRRVSRGGKDIDLQPREFRILEHMLRNRGRVVTRTMLLEHVWNYHFDPQTNVIDVHISRLRQKIDSGFDQKLIVTVRGSGYMIPAASG